MTATSSPTPAQGPTRRPSRSLVLLVPVPGDSAIHRLWAGTKLLVILAVTTLLVVYPGWVTIGLTAVLVLAAVRIARIPRGVLPTPHRAVWVVFAVGAATVVLAGGSPVLSIGGVSIGLGGVLYFLRIVTFGFVLLGMLGMLSWTTNVAEIGPALATLGRPFKLLRVPVDEWAVAVALGLRAFPMLIDEFQVLYAAGRLRPRQIPPTRKARRRQRTRDLIDLLATAVVVTLRRADEIGDAITARGGTGQLSAARARPKRADWVTLAVVAAIAGADVAIETVLHVVR